jgi:hypothetical protein
MPKSSLRETLTTDDAKIELTEQELSRITGVRFDRSVALQYHSRLIEARPAFVIADANFNAKTASWINCARRDDNHLRTASALGLQFVLMAHDRAAKAFRDLRRHLGADRVREVALQVLAGLIQCREHLRIGLSGEEQRQIGRCVSYVA